MEKCLITFASGTEIREMNIAKNGIMIIKSKDEIPLNYLQNLQNELREKCGFRGNIIVFQNGAEIEVSNNNPFSNILTDEQYQKLDELKVFDSITLRNIAIRQMYKESAILKPGEKKKSVSERLKPIQELYPHLTFDSLRKIAYGER